MAFCEQLKITLALVGKAGKGKSATGNSILGWPYFKSDEAETCTLMVDVQWVTYDNLVVKVVDTPGYVDSDKKEDIISTIIQIPEVMSVCPEGIHVFCLVLEYGARFYKEEIRAVEKIKEIFGADFLRNHGIIIMTKGESFDLNHEDILFHQWCDQRTGELKALMNDCNNRVVLFYNKGDKYESKRQNSVKLLLKYAKSIQIKGAYTSENFKTCFKKREEEILKHNIPKLSLELQQDLGEIMKDVSDLKKRNAATEEDLTRLKEAIKELLNKILNTVEKVQIKEKLIKKVQLIQRKLVIINLNKPINEQLHEIAVLLEDLKNPPISKKTVALITAVIVVTAGILTGGVGLGFGVIALQIAGASATAGASVTGLMTLLVDIVHKKLESKRKLKEKAGHKD
ncbi:GTPase IMAP family member 7-like [Physella acuta]|uniref:GTPase IMAP family member 7-like n=1 Tax=Physella acuta TaxID=109671 RepID=UPI0027DB3B44|nr:GTPase IMAP family member 7-like [Physella acuta]XP_059173856.1 GTPase IMAP family member 7-like [Physella acuta]XP_059173857.1 GTPase IMAP family member 7-like [Physella acuta]XP_059173859.1 GTPase IMAP family member 7-like [Physella acuta]XP_059173860.1 GTPase IMAP family member 7-like [Physella acuta]